MSVLLVATYYRDLNIVKKGKTIIKRNEVHVLKALVKIVVKLYNKKKIASFHQITYYLNNLFLFYFPWQRQGVTGDNTELLI